MSLQAFDRDGLLRIVNEIHDWWLDLDAMEWNAAGGNATIPVGEHRSRMTRFLRIRCALEVECVDEAHVSLYDVNSLEYDEEERVLRITTGVPLILKFRVARLDVELEEM